MSHPWSQRSSSIVAQADATFDFYMNWLEERDAEFGPQGEKISVCTFTKEQCVEMSEQFAMSQVPPELIKEPDDVANETVDAKAARISEQKAAQKKLDMLREIAHQYTIREMAGLPRIVPEKESDHAPTA
jgi:hypothetical protein